MVKLTVYILLTSFWSVFACAEIRTGDDKSFPAEHHLMRDGIFRHRGHETMELRKEGELGEDKKKTGVVDHMAEGQESEERSRKLTPSTSMILRELRHLKESVNGLKAQSNLLYKQLKAFHKSCAAAAALDTDHTTSLDPSSSSSSSSLSSSSFPSSIFSSNSPVSATDNPDDVGSINNAIQSDALLLNQAANAHPCPPDFVFLPDHNGCFRLSAERVTWRTARERCLAMNSDLASIESSRKQRVLIENAKTNPETRHCDFWIGLTRHGSSSPSSPFSSSSNIVDWKWTNNNDSPTFTNWNFNEPNNGKGNEHCAQMLWIFHWKWNDAPCNYGNACYICQAKPHA